MSQFQQRNEAINMTVKPQLPPEQRKKIVTDEVKGLDYLVSTGKYLKEDLYHVVNYEDERAWTPYQTIIDPALNSKGVDIVYELPVQDPKLKVKALIDVKTIGKKYNAFFFELFNEGEPWPPPGEPGERFTNKLTFGNKMTTDFLFMFQTQSPRIVAPEEILRIVQFHDIHQVKWPNDNVIGFTRGEDAQRRRSEGREDFYISEKQLIHYLGLPIEVKYEEPVFNK